MNKVEIILNDYLNHNDLEGAISFIFNSEDEINNEINKFKKDNKNYIFEHIDFFYEYKKLSPFCTLGVIIFFSIKLNKLNFIKYLLLDERTIKILHSENCCIINDYIQGDFKINNTFYMLFKQKEINNYIKKNQSKLYDKCLEKTKFIESINIF